MRDVETYGGLRLVSYTELSADCFRHYLPPPKDRLTRLFQLQSNIYKILQCFFLLLKGSSQEVVRTQLQDLAMSLLPSNSSS